MSTNVVTICVRRVATLERVLIDTETNHALDAGVAGDQSVAVVDHGLMRAEPADTELAGHLRDCVHLAAHTPTHLKARSLSERRAD